MNSNEDSTKVVLYTHSMAELWKRLNKKTARQNLQHNFNQLEINLNSVLSHITFGYVHIDDACSVHVHRYEHSSSIVRFSIDIYRLNKFNHSIKVKHWVEKYKQGSLQNGLHNVYGIWSLEIPNEYIRNVLQLLLHVNLCVHFRNSYTCKHAHMWHTTHVFKWRKQTLSLPELEPL